MNKKGKIDNKGTATRKVLSMKARPIQIPKRKIKNLFSLLFILTKENIPRVVKDE